MSKNLEIEQKYRIKDPAVIRRRLRSIKARKLSAGSEFNEIYDSGNALLDEGKVLRLRHHGGKEGILTFKGPRQKGRHKKRVEIESRVEAAQTKKILESLGFKKRYFYNKYREEYLVGKAHVTIDKLAGFGWFVEIEGSSRLIDALEKKLLLKPEDREPKSYLELKLGRRPSSR